MIDLVLLLVLKIWVLNIFTGPPRGQTISQCCEEHTDLSTAETKQALQAHDSTHEPTPPDAGVHFHLKVHGHSLQDKEAIFVLLESLDYSIVLVMAELR